MTNTRDDRTKRVPLGTLRSKLTIPKDLIDDLRFQGRWAVDRPGRLQAAQDGGYNFVQDPTMTVEVGEGTDGRDKMSTAVCRVVGTHPDGTPMKAYLMKIRREWYEKDQREKQAEIDKTDESIQKGTVASQPGDKRYIGSQGITYKP